MKKIAFVLSLLLCLSCFAPNAEAIEVIEVPFEILKESPVRTPGKDCYDIMNNTSFEMLASEKQLFSWDLTSHMGRANTFLGCGFVDRTTDAHSGSYAMKITAPKAGTYADLVAAANPKAGETYEMSVWYKKLSGNCTGEVHLIFAGSKGGVALDYSRVKISFTDIEEKDGWVQRTARFVSPEYVSHVSVCLRFSGVGEILWDDVSFYHITENMPSISEDKEKPALQYIELKNASFEDDEAGKAPNPNNGWTAMHDAVISDEYSRTGKNSVKLTIPPGKTDALVYTYIYGFQKGATYQVSAWVRNPGKEKLDYTYWMYWSSKDFFDYADVSTQLGQTKQHFTVGQNADWEQIVLEFTPPENARSCDFNLRLRVNPGTLYLDDVSIYMVKAPYALMAETDETFYYSEWETGECNATPYFITNPETATATFSLVAPDGTEGYHENFTDVSNGVKYVFRTEWMTEKGKRYNIKMRVCDKDGNLIEEQFFPVFRFDRPTYLSADGIFRKNGKEYTYTFGSGVTMDLLPKKPEKGGVTVVQLYADDSGLTLEERLYKVYEQGMLALITLYSGTYSAGNPERLENTIDTVTRLKDHPAVFGWIVQDEAYQKGHSAEEMITAYETIRNIDPHHPVYLDDSVPGCYEWLFRYADFVDIDYYGGANPDAARHMSDIMDAVQQASKGRKPYSLMEQAFPRGGYLPSCDELRHMAYQAFFSGASGYGFHSLGIDSSEDNVTYYMDRPEWKDIAEKWGPWERDFMYGCFVTGEYKYVNYQKTDDVLWGTYTDGSDVYAIVLNRNKTKSQTAEVPLKDGVGNILFNSFIAQRMTGKDDKITATGSLALTLEPWEAVVWKISPNGEPINASHLKTSSFNDVISYPWAYIAIAALEEKGIVNSVSNTWYGPGQNVTRGDYAMFLVRALGLTATTGENFRDVAADAEYAKELAIGKAAGILQGIGDNKFNPEAEVTRQDMMTMTSRAMRLAGAADLSAFSDNASIADYAQAHVSAMVAEGLIKGNADGTINPLGNTTRAEAAVIMNRIINK